MNVPPVWASYRILFKSLSLSLFLSHYQYSHACCPYVLRHERQIRVYFFEELIDKKLSLYYSVKQN